jgi:hypothetical protein
VDIVDQIVERRIAEAAGRGEFDGLPGAGRPLELEDDALVAPEIRVAYRILKNAGYIPEEVRLLRELRTAEQLLARAVDPQERSSASARLRLLLERLGSSRAGPLQSQSEYFERLAERLAGARG